MAYARVYGLPEARAELRSGMLQALLANINRNSKDKVYRPEDFEVHSTLIEEVRAEDADEREVPEPKPFDTVAASNALRALLGKKD